MAGTLWGSELLLVYINLTIKHRKYHLYIHIEGLKLWGTWFLKMLFLMFFDIVFFFLAPVAVCCI